MRSDQWGKDGVSSEAHGTVNLDPRDAQITELQRRLKVAKEALEVIGLISDEEAVLAKARAALAEIRKEW